MQIPKKFENQLWEAMQSSFPNRQELRIMVQTGLEENLDHIVSPGTLPQTILDLIIWASAQGKFEDLLAAAQKENPGNADLVAFAERFSVWKASQDLAGETSLPTEEDGPATLSPPPGSISEYTNKVIWPPYVSPQSVHNWTEAMQTASRAVCRLETIQGDVNVGYGTGFLIGPRLILTADYIVPDANVEVRFDYEYAADDITPHQGTVHKLADHWLIDKRKNQYALILTEGSPGYDKVPGTNQPRGWLQVVPDYEVQQGEPLFFMGFYNAKPLTVGHYFALLDGRDSSPLITYCAYHSINARGTSGAPIFNAQWQVVGLHNMFLHTQNPEWEKGLSANIPLPAGEREVLVGKIKQQLGGRDNLRAGTAIKAIMAQPAVQLALAVSGH
jgi:V8-like Glu-specific endopeptidase